MKKLFLIALLFSNVCRAQYNDSTRASDWKHDKVELHIQKYEQQLQTGKAFFYTGGAIMTGSSLFLFSTSPDKINIASAVGFIGGVFSVYGFFTIVDSHRHEKKIQFAREGLTLN